MARRCIHCAEPAARRGICTGHYPACWRRVQAGRGTWSRLEGADICLPPSRGGSTKFFKRLDAVEAGK